MATYIEMPKLSDTMTEGTVVKWRKKDGDKVEVGDVLAEIETDKATMEMEAFDDGILHQILVQEGTKVPIGSKIALLLAKGEPAPAQPADTGRAEAKPAGQETKRQKQAEVTAPAKASNALATKAAPSTGGEGRIRISPFARKLAKERGVDVASLTGSGPGGRIIARDIAEGHGRSGTAGTAASGAPPAASRPAAVESAPLGPGDERIPLSGMRRVIAERLLASKTTIPHFYIETEVDAAALLKLRAEANGSSQTSDAPKLTINDFILKAVVAAVAKVPAVNASFAGDAIVKYANVNLAVAVAVEDGLVTPIIRKAQTKSLREISDAVKDLASRARSKKLKPEEYQGGTITVSNLGSYGVESFFAIINPPQSVIISIGAIVKKPVVSADDQIGIGHRMIIGLSADHRAVDGAIAAQYLSELRRIVENPALMLF